MKTAPKTSKAAAPAEKKAADPTVTVKLTAQQFNVIMAGLGELPHKHVGGLIGELVAQVQPQVNQQLAPAAANEE